MCSGNYNSLYEDLKISPLQNKRFKLVEDYNIFDYTINKGFVSNGADIPRMFWCINPPNDMDILPAVVLHDYLCSQANIVYNHYLNKQIWWRKRKVADKKFKEALKLLNTPKWKINLLYYGVRIGSYISRLWL